MAFFTYNDVKFSVDVLELSLFIDDGQSRNPLLNKLVEGLDDWRLVFGHFNVFVGSDPEVENGFMEVTRLVKVMNLKRKAKLNSLLSKAKKTTHV